MERRKRETYEVVSLRKRQSWIVSVQALLHSERSRFGTCFRVGLFIFMISSKAGRQKSVFNPVEKTEDPEVEEQQNSRMLKVHYVFFLFLALFLAAPAVRGRIKAHTNVRAI